jgi:hypothetical protein
MLLFVFDVDQRMRAGVIAFASLLLASCALDVRIDDARLIQSIPLGPPPSGTDANFAIRHADIRLAGQQHDFAIATSDNAGRETETISVWDINANGQRADIDIGINAQIQQQFRPCKSRVTEIFKNLHVRPGSLLKNLAVYMFEGCRRQTSFVAQGKAAAIGAAATGT